MNGRCLKCGATTPNEVVIAREPPDCPGCGGRNFEMAFQVIENFLPHDTTLVKQYDATVSKKKGFQREHFNGHQPNSAGKLMRKERLIDKNANIYYEHVSDPETGEVLRHEHGALDEHRGHGSAKTKKST